MSAERAYADGTHWVKAIEYEKLEAALEKVATVDQYTRGQCRSIARTALGSTASGGTDNG